MALNLEPLGAFLDDFEEELSEATADAGKHAWMAGRNSRKMDEVQERHLFMEATREVWETDYKGLRARYDYDVRQ
jgi:hypothetical protein